MGGALRARTAAAGWGHSTLSVPVECPLSAEFAVKTIAEDAVQWEARYARVQRQPDGDTQP